jgi:hypothetical protein
MTEMVFFQTITWKGALQSELQVSGVDGIASSYVLETSMYELCTTHYGVLGDNDGI